MATMSEAKQRSIDQQKTNEIHAHSRTRFSTLPVDKSPELEMLDNKDDGVDYVSIGVYGRDDQTDGIHTAVTLLATRYRRGEFELIDIDRKRTAVKTFDEWKAKLDDAAATLKQHEYRKRAFAKFRSRNR